MKMMQIDTIRKVFPANSQMPMANSQKQKPPVGGQTVALPVIAARHARNNARRLS